MQKQVTLNTSSKFLNKNKITIPEFPPLCLRLCLALQGTVKVQSFHKAHLSKVLMFCSHARRVGNDPKPQALELMGNSEAPGPPALVSLWDGTGQEKGDQSPRTRAAELHPGPSRKVHHECCVFPTIRTVLKVQPSSKPQKECEAPDKGLREQSGPPGHSEYYLLPFFPGGLLTQWALLKGPASPLHLPSVNRSRDQLLQKLNLLQTKML